MATPEAPAQTFSYYPAQPPPVRVRLSTLPDHPCPYLPGRVAFDRAVWADDLPADVYQRFMDAGFRRSGKLLYQPACRGCRACMPIRVPVRSFQPDKSQRRCARKNADLVVTVGRPELTDEKFELYRTYVRDWHRRGEPETAEGLRSFLYDSPLPSTIEFEYRTASSQLLAVGICDVCETSLSSVYFYFDPKASGRGLGTYGALMEIRHSRDAGLRYYYLGYWVAGCGAMEYKQNFTPNEVLATDGRWRSHRQK